MNERETCVDPSEIERQRTLGWPDFHPETYCHRCGRRNVRSWWVDSALWNIAVEHEQREVLQILCPSCFVELFERAGVGHCTWELRPDPTTTHNLSPEARAVIDP